MALKNRHYVLRWPAGQSLPTSRAPACAGVTTFSGFSWLCFFFWFTCTARPDDSVSESR